VSVLTVQLADTLHAHQKALNRFNKINSSRHDYIMTLKIRFLNYTTSFQTILTDNDISKYQPKIYITIREGALLQVF